MPFHERFGRAAIVAALAAMLAWPGASAAEGGERETANGASAGKRAAIVIDDLGNDMAGTAEVMSAPVRLTVAVMPFLPTTKRDAQWAHRVGHDVIVHMPMEPLRGKRKGLGPGAITVDLPEDEIRRRVEAAIDEVPYAVGMNNHMGSKATADERVMRIVLDVCKKRGLFFLDSKTNYRSIVAKVGAELGVPVVQNHIFLDDVSSTSHISRQLQLVQKHLADHDMCVAIGHVGIPGKKTAAVLHQATPAMAGEIRFVGVSELAGLIKLP
ncbi:divergent polysaccharide deacetylase family protein [Paenibacillus flagellatus]|uniref:Divergent polysaccharide deacetylase family protein n=1 Tax=Paenibacillus flagellatus TaxID=2211139 RepID=A0A2V5JYR1_9BACL|nr:divergent polysaccharide deacetylase family protein [Paenibacillus flagellatus]PYI51958.1 hypothetical protein DLM86_23340 [Paenibacillus flagellatus]